MNYDYEQGEERHHKEIRKQNTRASIHLLKTGCHDMFPDDEEIAERNKSLIRRENGR